MATTDIEKENLEAHVELCAERYKNLEQKLDSFEKRMTTVEEHLVAIRNNITQKPAGETSNSDKTIISIGTAIVAALISTITVLLVNYINK
jgi:prefoldin subunit 5